jgi:hypothetical protein
VLAEKGYNDEQIMNYLLKIKSTPEYSKILNVPQRRLWRLVLDSIENAKLNPATYNNQQLKRYPRRLIIDKTPTLNEHLSQRDRAAMYQNASQMCNSYNSEWYIKKAITNDTSHIWFARNKDSAIVSFAVVTTMQHTHTKHNIAMVNLICAQRGQGMALMKSLVDYYNRHKFDWVRLDAIDSAVDAYRRVGFKRRIKMMMAIL